MEDSPSEQNKRFVAVLNKKVETGKLLNALGHMAAGLGGAGKSADMRFAQYTDADNSMHPHISDFPFIVLQADNSNQIRGVRAEAIVRGIPFTDFTSTMTTGTAQEQHEKTRATPESDLEYYGICMFGDTTALREFTKKFSLYK